MSYTGVSPVNQLTFKVNNLTVKDAEALNMSFSNGIEEWNPMDQDGWVNRLMTSKSVTISMGGKRNYGDEGNDYVAGLAFKNGKDAEAPFEITFPDGAKLKFENAVINVTSMGGDSTAVGALEWEVQSNGKPVYTPATAE